MLIEFHAANYRSIKGAQKLSMVAAKDTSCEEANCVPSGIPNISLVRTAVLYGPNASGKSNLISALQFMQKMVETSAIGIREGQTLNIAPFRFDPITNKESSEFEVTFIENKIRYQYGFVVNSARIIKEWLLVYVKQKPQCWFQRDYDSEKNKYLWDFGSHLVGGKNQHHLWSESTRANALFLSTAVNLNSEQLRPIFNWFVNKLVIVGSNSQPLPLYTMECIKNELDKPQIIKFLQAADLGITDVQIKMQKTRQVQLRFEQGFTAIESVPEKDTPTATFFHQSKKQNNTVGFSIEEESHGTQKLFAYAGPILDILKHGKILVVDELDSSLHPKMVSFLVNLIQNADLNKKNPQLIFTTHNTYLLNTDFFRRDQIWFMEKDDEQASHLYPLTDFSPRKGEALEKGYLIGRYGALPYLGEFNL